MALQRKTRLGLAPPRLDGAIDVAVVIPAYKQPGFLPEAIESVLAQNAEIGIAAVVVDDGCPFVQTAKVGLDYSRAHPGRVFYLRRPNGGLSAARNTGVEFALHAFPECAAIYFLDADNRLLPDFMRRTWDALRASNERVGWIYTDIDMFGMAQNCSVRGPYSVLMHLLDNYCEAGSLVGRAVFEAGVRFDEAMRLGFEDWEFWMQAARAGFRGRYLAHAGFRYRRRAESMLAQSERLRETILGYMRKKHEAFLRPPVLLALESEELPRFAIYEVDKGRVCHFVDPLRAAVESFSPNDDRIRLFRAQATPVSASYPSMKGYCESDALEQLGRWRLVRNVFWCAQKLLREVQIAYVRIGVAAGNEIALSAAVVTEGKSKIHEASMVFVRADALVEAAKDASTTYFDAVLSQNSSARLAEIHVKLPNDAAVAASASRQSMISSLLFDVGRLRSIFARSEAHNPEWRPDFRAPRTSGARALELLCGTSLIFPHLSMPGEIHVGFVLPVVEFGGVEKVVLNYAATLARAGLIPHLFITGSRSARMQPEALLVFESVNFLADDNFEAPDWNQRYFGVWTPRPGPDGSVANAVGLLATMQVVVNTHSLGAHGVMARLRSLGVKTFLGLHLLERAASGQPVGNAQASLAYEHAYDGIVVISEQMRDWCIGQAIPAEKVFKIANAPSYPVDSGKLRRALEARRRRASEALNVLYLGRLDAQKGLDRLSAVVRATDEPEIRWRIVGKAIVGDSGVELEALQVVVEPPVFSPNDLDALYQWADVVVLCSRFEGVPLTILEAQRFGCVALATNVGAVSEIVRHEQTGLLIEVDRDEDAIVADFVSALQALRSDRGRMREIGLRAAERVCELGWDKTMREWISRLFELTGTSESQ